MSPRCQVQFCWKTVAYEGEGLVNLQSGSDVACLHMHVPTNQLALEPTLVLVGHW